MIPVVACTERKNADGDIIGAIVGSYQEDAFKEHAHEYNDIFHADGSGDKDIFNDGKKNIGTMSSDRNNNGFSWDRITHATGDAETRPKNIAVNFIIKASE